MSISARARLGTVIPLIIRPSPRVGPPWSNEELAQLYGVAQVLGRAGLAIDTENGVTDEGDPWFAFVRPDTVEVVAHFARIDGRIVGTGLSVAAPVTGERLREVVSQLLYHSRGKSFALRDETRSVILRPIVGLATFVAIGLLAMNEAEAHGTDVHEDRSGYLKAALDFIVDHIRATSDAAGSAAADGRQAAPAAAENARATVNGNSDVSGTKYFQVLASVIAIALTFTGSEQGAEMAPPDLLAIERLIGSGAADTAAAGEGSPAEQSGTSVLAAAGDAADPSERPWDALEVAFEGLAQDAPVLDLITVQEEPGPAEGTLAKIAERPEAEATTVRPVTARADLLDTSLVVHDEDSQPAVARAAEPAVAASTTPAPAAAAGGTAATFLLAYLLEPAKAPTLIEGHSYVMLNFTSSLQPRTEVDRVELDDAPAPIASLTTVSLNSETTLAESTPTQAPVQVVAEPAAPLPQPPPLFAPVSKVLDLAAVDEQMVKLSAGAETVLFNGGNVLIQNFQMGVDKLLVASPLLDWSKATVTITWEGDAVFRFDEDSSVTLMGVWDMLSA
ncbi:MAG: hypothetical protein FJX55_17070 [Alphaproteobacteria bacterium]|nr:hypothetical protein [Alphaproteobacteria bacterium]